MNNKMTDSERFKKFKELMQEHVTVGFSNWLIENGFFTAPASTKYHGNYAGGLFDHSIEVAKALVDLTEKNGLKWKNPRSPYIVGMFHDLCKIDNYIEDHAGGWMHNLNADPRHGEKSVFFLSNFIFLTEEEILCIRWHMGAFDDRDNWSSFTMAVREYPNVLWTHQADMIAAHVIGV